MRRQLLYLLVFIAYASGAAHAYNFTLPSNAPANFSASFNSTLAYIGMVNRSSYVVFYPNLTGAYASLASARADYSTNASAAYMHLSAAHEDAATELAKIYSYRVYSFIVMVVLVAASATALYLVMRAPKVVGKNQIKR